MATISTKKNNLVFVLLLLLTACSGFNTKQFEKADTIQQFSSVKEAETYLQSRDAALAKLYAYARARELEQHRKKINSSTDQEVVEEVAVVGLRASLGAMPDATVSEALMRVADVSITNNQEAMVDEGGIVKRSGDYLVVLRKGRLYSIHIGAILTKADEIDLQPQGWKHGAWYDELLIFNKTLVVTGYSYEGSNTEYVFFQISDDGKFTRKGAWLVSSSDYFSESNYASRLIDNNLVFYIENLELRDISQGPSELAEADPFSPIAARVDENGQVQEYYPLFSEHEIYSPVLSSRYLTVSSVIICPIETEHFSCKAKSVMGAGIESYYASSEAYYFWMRGSEWNIDYSAFTDRQLQLLASSRNYRWWQPEALSVIYRIPFNDAPIGAVKLKGSPIDQFSFSQDAGHLHLLGRESKNDGFWFSADYEAGSTFVASVPLEMFDQGVSEYPTADYIEISEDSEGYKKNRFVDNKLVYASGSENEVIETTVRVIALDESKHISELVIDMEVSDLHPLGDNMLIVGEGNDHSMQYQTLSLNDDIYIADKFVEPDGQATESRSHGFFFKPDIDGGIFAIPASTQQESDWKKVDGDYYFAEGFVDMLYTRVDLGLKLYPAGILEGNKTVVWQKEEDCEVSCYDWYGSSRPIFWGSRIFALLKDELVEGVHEGGVIRELQRIDIRN